MLVRRLIDYTKKTIRQADLILLVLCLAATAFGTLVIASATNAQGGTRYVAVQIVAALLGVGIFFIVSAVDIDFITEHRNWLVAINCFMLLLLFPFGVTPAGSDNRSWLELPFMPVQIQPAEICKIFFVPILASVMATYQNNPSRPKAVMHLVFHTGLIVGLNMIISKDLGVSLIFVSVFLGMAFAGGVSLLWFAATAGGIAALAPIMWSFLEDYQKRRILIVFDSSIDPNGINERYHTVRSLKSLMGGGMTGQGLFNGTRTQIPGALPAQHTDYIFSAIGEELGFIGCLITVLLIAAIIARCIWVGTRSSDYKRRLICFGVSAALMFQLCINVGMCIGVAPVIGLTLPFISYGGSSLISLYAMVGLVAGVFARPSPTSQERYIRPPYKRL